MRPQGRWRQGSPTAIHLPSSSVSPFELGKVASTTAASAALVAGSAHAFDTSTPGATGSAVLEARRVGVRRRQRGAISDARRVRVQRRERGACSGGGDSCGSVPQPPWRRVWLGTRLGVVATAGSGAPRLDVQRQRGERWRRCGRVLLDGLPLLLVCWLYLRGDASSCCSGSVAWRSGLGPLFYACSSRRGSVRGGGRRLGLSWLRHCDAPGF
jgi:hypothetical protein